LLPIDFVFIVESPGIRVSETQTNSSFTINHSRSICSLMALWGKNTISVALLLYPGLGLALSTKQPTMWTSLVFPIWYRNIWRFVLHMALLSWNRKQEHWQHCWWGYTNQVITTTT